MAEATLRLDTGDVDDHRRHRLTTSLFNDLRTLHLVNVHRATRPTPDGAKSDLATEIADLVIKGVFSAGTIAAVCKVITSFIHRTKARSVTWVLKDGRKVVF